MTRTADEQMEIDAGQETCVECYAPWSSDACAACPECRPSRGCDCSWCRYATFRADAATVNPGYDDISFEAAS